MSYLTDIARSVVPYESSDKAALRAFQRAHFGAVSRQCDDSFSHWLFNCNPHRDPNQPSMWLCKRDGGVVGQQASIPVRLQVEEFQYRASWLIDLMVNPAWRLKGVAPALFAAFEKNTEVMLGLGLEDGPYRVVRRGGWHDVGSMSLFVRPLDPLACAQGLNAPKLLPKLVPRVLARGTARATARVAGGITGVSLERVGMFDERINAVWTSARRDYRIVAQRDFASVRWRFDEIPYHGYYERYYLRRRRQVIGYAVIRMTTWHGYPVARVVDYFAEQRWVPVLLTLLIEEANSRAAVAVFIEQLHAAVDKVLWRLGCLRVRSSERFVLKTRDDAAPLVHTLRDAKSWFITPGDSDLDEIAIGLAPSTANAAT